MTTPTPQPDRSVLDPLFSEDLAERILSFSLPATVNQRLEYLRARANEGQLSEDERAEYEQIVDDLDFLGELRATAQAVRNRRAS